MLKNQSESAVVSSTPTEVSFYGMQYSLFITVFVEVLGGIFFLLTALYIVRDREEAESEAQGKR